MTIGRFCKACLARLSENDFMFCSSEECQQGRRSRVLVEKLTASFSDSLVLQSRTPTAEEFGSAMSKEDFVKLLDSDLAHLVGRISVSSSVMGRREHAEEMTALRALRENVTKHPWDDCSSFLVRRISILEDRDYPKGYSGGRTEIVPPTLSGNVEGEKTPVPACECNECMSLRWGSTPPWRAGLREKGVREKPLSLSEKYGLSKEKEPKEKEQEKAKDFAWPFLGSPRPIGLVRRGALGLGPVSVPSSEVAVVQVMPQISFRGSHLFVPSEIAPNFEICGLRIGAQEMFASANPIPASACSGDLGLEVAMADALPGMNIEVLVRNKSFSAAMFSGCLRGVFS